MLLVMTKKGRIYTKIVDVHITKGGLRAARFDLTSFARASPHKYSHNGKNDETVACLFDLLPTGSSWWQRKGC